MFVRVLSGLAAVVAAWSVSAQSVSFVDGYHGGIYGHYPLWNTQFYVDKLAEYPLWRINLEIEPETWDTVKLRTPEAYLDFKAIAGSSPRIEFINPAYAQPYAYNISGESLIRQFEYGMKKIRSHFSDVQFVTYSAEEPCFTSAMPGILRSFGFRYASLKNPDTCWGGYTRAYGGELVNWIGPDGSSLLTVPRYECEELEDNSTWQTKAWNNSPGYLKACADYGISNIVGMCIQDAGWRNGPWIGYGDKVAGGSVYRTWREYFEQVSAKHSDDDWRFSQEDVLANLMWGTQVLQKLAQEVRVAENNIVMAEKADAMDRILTGRSADAASLDEAWRTLFMSQHHDCWIVPYNRVSGPRTWAQEVTRWTGVTDSIASVIMNAAGENPTSGIRVMNTTSVPRSELVSVRLPEGYSSDNTILMDASSVVIPVYVDGGSRVSFIVSVPAFGYADYRFADTRTEKGRGRAVEDNVMKAWQDADGIFVVESDLYRMELDPARGGAVRSLISKKLGGKEFVDRNSEFGFNAMRGYFYDHGGFMSNADTAAVVSVVESTPFAVTVAIDGVLAGHPCRQTLTLYRGEERIDCTLDIDWQGNEGIGKHREDGGWDTKVNARAFRNDKYKLVLTFPAMLSGQKIFKNAPFDVCESRLDDTFFDSFDNIKHNITLNWVDVMQQDEKYGLTLLTDHTTSYTHGKDFPLGLTLQYSGKGLWGVDYKINGPTSVRYALLPHKGKWDDAGVWTKSVNWNEPLIVRAKTEGVPQAASLIGLDRPGYEITTARVGDGSVMVRLFNAESDARPVVMTLGFPVKAIEEVELDGSVVRQVELKDKKGVARARISVPRFGIRTFRVCF